jgi:hypothetical protein
MTFGALDNEVIGSHTRREFEELIVTWGWRCFYCARPVRESIESADDQVTEDHLTPLSRGGVDFLWNIVPACLRCNRLKGALTADEFRAARPGLVQGPAKESTATLTFKKPALSNLAQQTVDYLKPRLSMDAGQSPEYYRERRELLKKQTYEIRRLQQVSAGQMTLPIFGDDSARKIPQTDEAALTLAAMHVTEPIRRKA